MELNCMDLVDELHLVEHMAAHKGDFFQRESWYGKVDQVVNWHIHEPTTQWTIYVS